MRIDDLTSDSSFISAEKPLLDSRFTDIELLHSNPATHSELYVATRFGKRFILKALKKEHRTNSLYRGMLLNEFDIGYSLSHQNIAQTLSYECVEPLGEVVVMEYVDGVTLQQALEKGRLSSATTRKLLAELCDALHYMHSLQVVHRDIKPENIMLTHNGQNVKLIDFGLSCIDSQTLFKQPAGTRRYASPELLDGKPIDNRSDIYALGAIIALLARTARQRRVAKRCLSYERDARYADALSVKQALMPFKVRRYTTATLGLLIIIGAASYAGYKVGVDRRGVKVVHTETIREVADSATIEQSAKNSQAIESVAYYEEQFNALYREMQREVCAALDAHYAQLNSISSREELSAHSLRGAGFVDEYSALAAKRVDEIFGPNYVKSVEHKQVLRSMIDELWTKSLTDHNELSLETIQRVVSSN